MEYILWLDADDVFTEKDYEEFKQLKASLAASVDSVAMKYNLAFDEYGNVTFSLRRNRLVKRSNGFRWIGAVHEYLEVWGNIVNSDIAVTHRSLHHDSDRNLNIYEKRLAEGEHFTPRDLYYFANELSDHQRFEQAIEFYEKFLATGQGWIEDVISTCGKLADCYHRLGNKDKVLESTLRTLQYDAPRAEYCCRLGFYFLSESKLEPAIYWYETALQRKPDAAGWGFQKPDYWTFIPHLQLCVCYDRKGDYKAANAHNERARSYRPEDARVMHNKRYLESRLAHEE
jgi:tetratricopeptide (TPR) repeat protein